MQNFQSFIDIISKGRKIHICVHDMTGVLAADTTAVARKNAIHTKAYCDAAKSTPKGRRLCLWCKMLANNKATCEKKPFSGRCPWGLEEAAYPVIKNGNVIAIVYVGNFITDVLKTEECIKKACLATEVSESRLRDLLNECDRDTTADEALSIAEIVSDYLLMLCQKTTYAPKNYHWLVGVLKNYADSLSNNDISLSALARIYHKNEKYMGRLFKKETGKSYSEYCNDVRLDRAAELLVCGSGKIIDIALECGFNHVSYFNRSFKMRYGMSPSQYRREYAMG